MRGLDFGGQTNLNLRVGQYKIAHNRQRVISSGNLQLVERSIAQKHFTLDRDIGLDLRSKDLGGLKRFKYVLGVFMGYGRGFFELSDEFSPLFLARIEYLPWGGFKDDYSEADFERSARPKLSIAMSYGYNSGRCKVKAKGRVDTRQCHNLEFDALFKIWGFSFLGEFYWRQGKGAAGLDAAGTLQPAPMGPNAFGFFAQAGYLLPRQPIELAARYSDLRPTARANSSISPAHEIGGGVSWYFARHPLKLQGDFFHHWTQDFKKAKKVFRLQLQVSM